MTAPAPSVVLSDEQIDAVPAPWAWTQPTAEWKREFARSILLAASSVGAASVVPQEGVSEAAWVRTSERRPQPGDLIVKRWKSGSVWAGTYSGTDKDSSFDEWYALPGAAK